MGVRVEVFLTVNDAGPDLLTRLAAGETLAAHRGMTLSVDRSPWDEGTLADAHAVIPATDPEEGAAIVVDTPYAARLHEHPEYNFSTDANPNAQGKWVEETMVENARELGEIIAKQVSGA